MSRFPGHGSTLVLATEDGYWIARKCLYERVGAIYDIRTVASSAPDADLGREVFQAIRDFAPCDPAKIGALLEQFARAYPDPEEWPERYDNVSVLYRPKLDAENLELHTRPAGIEKSEKSLLAASSGDAEIGAHIRSMLKKVRPQSRPTTQKRPSTARGKPKT